MFANLVLRKTFLCTKCMVAGKVSKFYLISSSLIIVDLRLYCHNHTEYHIYLTFSYKNISYDRNLISLIIKTFSKFAKPLKCLNLTSYFTTLRTIKELIENWFKYCCFSCLIINISFFFQVLIMCFLINAH